ncbi:alginate lyase family protein [Olivibacter sp. SDN3]|uniref:alginate lyase family protein n=1 Tax=Olivibacter sp. SDN3 TaxID=2764720 RepID=UPI00165126DD|nr:alginate lyase family protein [Olivibacter sp. SDN3]QNL51602.1 alginate lyase family protein [Olivibacter sp. SDN3]
MMLLKRTIKAIQCISMAVFLMCCTTTVDGQQLQTYISNPEVLESNLEFLQKGNNASVKQAIELLKAQGNTIMKRQPRSVVEKSYVPPSGDKHDFVSLAGYYWPDPKKKDGLPYIHKDGQWNPEASKIKDRSDLIQMSKDVRALGTLYYYTKDEQYAKKATEFLTRWFLNDKTKMNPNLQFGQGVRGVNEGRSVGMVDTRDLVDLLDGVQLLSGSQAWTASNNNQLKAWFKDYLNWMLTSNIGKSTQNITNNIGTAYLAQVVCFSVYTDQPQIGRKYFDQMLPKLFDDQFESDGKQPHELKRKDAWMYSNSNLNQWMKLLQLARLVDFDLWGYSYKGKSLEKAYSWMLPYSEGKAQWTYGKKEGVDMRATFEANRKRAELHRATGGAELSVRRNVANAKTSVANAKQGVLKLISGKSSENNTASATAKTTITNSNALSFLTEVNF